jgi:hypothetical protein
MPELTEEEKLILRWAPETAIVKVRSAVKGLEKLGKIAKQEDVVNWMLANTKFTREEIEMSINNAVLRRRLRKFITKTETYLLSGDPTVGC